MKTALLQQKITTSLMHAHHFVQWHCYNHQIERYEFISCFYILFMFVNIYDWVQIYLQIFVYISYTESQSCSPGGC
jgi:hypothetical protein